MEITSDSRPALDGLTVLDLSRVLAGPYCSMLLSDLGARVVKIERPPSGDDTRAWGPRIWATLIWASVPIFSPSTGVSSLSV